ncbi:MAG: hypothetical protein LYZ70_06665 [Nitrososphaerales archaeon]|nr:hypothetical protein [Nitrososphaerales archaeon]
MNGKPGEQSNGVHAILAKIQFDHWVIIGAAPICSLMSHSHSDHHPEECSVYQTPIVASTRQVELGRVHTNNLPVASDNYQKYDKLYFWYLDRTRMNAQSEPKLRRFHADWWYVTDGDAGLLFIGDLDLEEIPAIEDTVNYVMNAAQRPLSAVLLPSYGGIKATHGVPADADPQLLSREVAKLAKKLGEKGLRVGGLPHPVRAPWSDLDFQRLPQKV